MTFFEKKFVTFSILFIILLIILSIPLLTHAQIPPNDQNNDIPYLIATEAHKFGVPPQIALYIALNESGWRADAKGDFSTSTMTYTSFGLFQLHKPERFGLTIEQALDPLTNIDTALKIMIDDGSLRQWSTCVLLNVPALCKT